MGICNLVFTLVEKHYPWIHLLSPSYIFLMNSIYSYHVLATITSILSKCYQCHQASKTCVYFWCHHYHFAGKEFESSKDWSCGVRIHLLQLWYKGPDKGCCLSVILKSKYGVLTHSITRKGRCFFSIISP